MKPIIRTTVGFASCLLAAAGMMRAAERIDPLTRALEGTNPWKSVEAPGESCATPCHYITRADARKAMANATQVDPC